MRTCHLAKLREILMRCVLLQKLLSAIVHNRKRLWERNVLCLSHYLGVSVKYQIQGSDINPFSPQVRKSSNTA